MPRLTLVLGGAASGKSATAETLVEASGLRRIYVATARPDDDEMRAKIARHRRQRGAGWRTIEAPLDPGAALAGRGPDEIVLVDCLTLWLSNLVLGGHEVEAETDRLTTAIRASGAPIILVSNETGLGIVPDNALARRFRNAQGLLNQRMAALADLVVLVSAGLPLTLKGQWPGPPA